MAITVKHSKVSTIPDTDNTDLVRPSDWNADHVLTGTIPVANGGTGADNPTDARTNLSAAQSGTNSDITSMTGVTGGISTPDFVQYDTTATPTIALGKERWNVNTGTLAFGIIDGTQEVQIGQQMYAQAVNAEAITITKGQPVYLYQATGNRASVKLAYNTSDATSAKTLGLAAQDITAGATGFIITQGVLDKLNTGSYLEGDTLYLGATAGTLTATKPAAPNHLVYIGVVERANNGNGQIYVRVQNGYELDEIHDVQINSPTTGQTIVYNQSTQLWNNSNSPRLLPRVSTTTSNATPTINTDTTDIYGLTAQTVDITSFTTNLSGTPSNGQRLMIYIVGTAARAITWGSSFESSSISLPTTTVSTNRLDVGFVWNDATLKWRCVAVA